MGSDIFRFKQFSVAHGKSSMKVGVDAVLLGAWAYDKKASEQCDDRELKILDVGCGCGVISLILAQRFPEAKIIGVEIDEPSVDEARDNFSAFPGKKKPEVIGGSFPEVLKPLSLKFDLIISNPPFFRSGVSHPSTSRERARHQGLLSPFTLVADSSAFLKPDGILAMIFPSEFYEEVISAAATHGFSVWRLCLVRNNPNRPEKRVLIEFLKDKEHPNNENYKEWKRGEIAVKQHLTLFENGEPTEAYRKLCQPFYLYF